MSRTTDRMPNTPPAPPSGASPAARLLAEPVRVINVGLEGFAQELAGQSVAVIHVQWSPPAEGDPHLARLLAELGT